MNLAQRIILGATLLLMGLVTFEYISAFFFFNLDSVLIDKDNFIHFILLIGFMGGGLFVLFGIKRKKKMKEKQGEGRTK